MVNDEQVDARRQVRNRLRRLEGQVRAVSSMIDEQRSCEDVVVQLTAIRGALDEVIRKVLTDRVAECLATLPPEEARQAISRAVALLSRR